VPHGFDASKSSDKYAVVDVSSTPPTLAKRTTCFEREVIEYLGQPDNMGRSFRILDFKRGLELQHVGGNHLAKTGEFECRSPDELLNLIQG
jgi:hypothetical protein